MLCSTGMSPSLSVDKTRKHLHLWTAAHQHLCSLLTCFSTLDTQQKCESCWYLSLQLRTIKLSFLLHFIISFPAIKNLDSNYQHIDICDQYSYAHELALLMAHTFVRNKFIQKVAACAFFKKCLVKFTKNSPLCAIHSMKLPAWVFYVSFIITFTRK